MKDERPSDRLLDDIAEDALPAGFRDGLLECALGEVRSRRRNRSARRALLCLALMAGAFLAVWRGIQPGQIKSSQGVCVLIRTQTLGTDFSVQTKAGTAAILATSSGLITEITTAASERSFKEFSDWELLDFLSDKPVVLVSSAPNQAHLVFVNPEDAGGFALP